MKIPSFPPPVTTKPSAQASLAVFTRTSDSPFWSSWNKNYLREELPTIITLTMFWLLTHWTRYWDPSTKQVFFLSGEFTYLHLTHFPRGAFVKQGPKTNFLSFFATASLVERVIEVVLTLSKKSSFMFTVTNLQHKCKCLYFLINTSYSNFTFDFWQLWSC